MTEIMTKYGMMDDGALDYREEVTDNEHERTVAYVWTFQGEIVKRSVHVTLKQGIGLPVEQGGF